jgi:hypothetical protein
VSSGALSLTRRNGNSWKTAAGGLMLAAIIVGVAIVVGGSAARALNGVGAVLWLASGVMLAISLPAPERRALGWAAAVASGLLLGAIVRPGSLVPAIVGFGIAGAIVAFAAGDRTGVWALLVPAIYLPVHLLIGIGRALLTERGVRTEPPPTAAIVPLVMLLAAGAGGALVAWHVRRGRGR